MDAKRTPAWAPRGLLLALLATAAHSETTPPAIPWQTDYVKASQATKQAKRPLLLDFYADWCGPCKLMERTTFRDPEVVGVLRQMTCVRVNVDKQPKVAQQFSVSSIPRVIVHDARGAAVVDLQGYADADALLELLKSAAKQLGGLKFTAAPAEAPPASDQSLAALIEALGNPQRAAREEAARKLRQLGDKAVPPLLDALTHKHLAVRIGAWGAFRDLLGPPKAVVYDPWMPKARREAGAQAVRTWWEGKRKR